MKKRTVTGLLVACAILAPARAQEAGGLPVISTEDLVIELYNPANVDVKNLFEVASRLVGRSFCVQERGGLNGPPVVTQGLRHAGRAPVVPVGTGSAYNST